MEITVERIAKRIAERIPTAKESSEQVERIHGVEAKVPRVDVGWRCRSTGATTPATPQTLLSVPVIHLPLVLVTNKEKKIVFVFLTALNANKLASLSTFCRGL